MLVYKALKRDFMEDVHNNRIADIVNQKFVEVFNKKTTDSEYRAWDNSMRAMYFVLDDPEIPNNLNIAIEYNIPQTSRRVDFMISGVDGENNAHVVILELKQWESVDLVEGQNDIVKTFIGGNPHKTAPHPSYQASSYAKVIKDFNAYVQDNMIHLNPCAYLHNYRLKVNDPLYSTQYAESLSEAPAFVKGDEKKLREFIKSYVKFGTNKNILYDIDCGRIRPSKSLQDVIANMLRGNKEFTLIDDQKVSYEAMLYLAKKCKADGKKRTIIAVGGPGTGKTVIAINLLCELTHNEFTVHYASKNKAPRSVYLKKLKGNVRDMSVDNMFKSTGSYYKAKFNEFDTIIVDEGHRLNEKSGLYKNNGENQIKEIINASKFNVFFIDENQKVTTSDIGSIDEIKKWAGKLNSEVSILELSSQFRCNGSDGYIAFIDDVLGIRETANFTLGGVDYDVKVFDDPNELRTAIVKKNSINNKSRILAGYCWDWITKSKYDENVHDIVIGDFSMSWNLNNTETYAIDEGSINQVGCIHTTQGLEFDYVGVIIGEDMVYKDNSVLTDYTKRAKTDKSLFGIKKMMKSEPEKATKIADEIIRNTYRTLMTRGMKGCYIYCVDKDLNEYLKRRIQLR